MLKKLLAGPLRFTPKQDEDGKRYYEFEGEGTLAKMLVSVTHPILVASPTGRWLRWTGVPTTRVSGLASRAARVISRPTRRCTSALFVAIP